MIHVVGTLAANALRLECVLPTCALKMDKLERPSVGAGVMSDTTLRHLAMLREIPGRPGKITATQLHQKLEAQGFVIDKRSVERDLHSLSTHFALVSDNAKPAGWSWEKHGDPMQFPSMGLSAAITWQLLERHLTPLLPLALLQDLKPQFDQSRKALAQLKDAPLGRWSERIAAISPGLELMPPKIPDRVREVVNEALLRECQFEASYLAVERKSPTTYRFHPLGLVMRGGVLYLVATVDDFTDPRQWPLHRMAQAELLETRANAPRGFDFKHYVHQMQAFDFPTGRMIQLELVVNEWLARHLSESRLSDDQRITPTQDGKLARITATVMETQQLEWWLRSLGANVSVKKPVALRRRIRAEAKTVAGAV